MGRSSSLSCCTTCDTTPLAVECDILWSKSVSSCSLLISLDEADYVESSVDSDEAADEPGIASSLESDSGSPSGNTTVSVCCNGTESFG